MFGISRRKSRTKDAFKGAADAVYDALIVQTMALRNEEFYISNDGVNFNCKALGYIFGFFDTTLQKRGLDIRDDEGVTTLPYLLARLFPKETDKTETYVAYLKQNMYHDPDALNGMQLGEQEAFDFLGKGKPATGLAFCMWKIDEMAGNIETTERSLAGAAAGSAHFEAFQRTSHQSKPVEDLHGSADKLDDVFEAFQGASHQSKPAEDLHNLILGISHHLDNETSARKTIYDRLLTIENQTKRRASRGFVRYLVAICIGVAGTLAWQSYGDAVKQIIATRAPELGWSPGAKQMIATSIRWLGWTKPPAGPENIAPETVANISKQPATFSLQQVQEIHADIAAVRQTLERELAHMRETVTQLAASQELIGREIADLQATDQEILKTNAAPPPQPPAAAARNPIPVPPPPAPATPQSSRTPIPPH